MDTEHGIIDFIIDTALCAGALKAEYVPSEAIIVSAEFRKMCEMNSCGLYGRCWTCPPAIGDIAPLMEEVKSYRGGVLYQTVHSLEDSYDFEGMMDAKRLHGKVSAAIRQALSDAVCGRHLHLSCGGCFLCEKCAILVSEPCRHPEETIPSMEAYGIDVYRTTAGTDLHYINGKDTVTYFGIVLIDRQTESN